MPVLFNAYNAPLTKLLNRHDVQQHLVADDTRLFFEQTYAIIPIERRPT